MNDVRITSLFASLDQAVELLAQTRTPDSACAVAYDSLKQARALVTRAFGARADGPESRADWSSDAPAQA